MEIIELPIKALKPYKRNPRKNDKAVEYVANSIRNFGFKVPIVIDENYEIVCGHTRWKAAKTIGLDTVPCIMADDLNEDQIRAFRLADNKTAEMADWDFDLLEMEFNDIDPELFDMSDFGFFQDDEPEKTPTEVTEDDFDESTVTEAVCKRGQIWVLGCHRLMCGDSTSVEDVARLMNGKKADMVFTDPPYGMKKESEGVLNDNLNSDDLLGFNRQWIPLTFGALKDNGSWYCWGIDEPLMDIYSNILKPMERENRITFRNLITWDKGNGQGQLSEDFRMYPVADEKCLFVMCGTQNYYDEYLEIWEPIRKYMIGEKTKAGLKTCKEINKIIGSSQKGGGMANHYFGEKVGQFSLPTEEMYSKLQKYCTDNSIKAFEKEYEEIKKEYEEIKKEYYSTRAYFDNTHDNQNNVWHFDRAGKDEREHTGGHATPKPIALCSRAIKSSSRESEIVLDVFGGSGSTLIACEQLNRKCYICELDAHYCDVIIKRWEDFTGKKAVLLGE